MSVNERQGRAVLAALTGASLIGLAPIAIRVSEVGPHATNLWRFLFALPILALWAGVARANPSPRQTGLLLAAGLLFGIEISLWAAALGLTTVVNATLLVNLTPVFAAGLAWVLLKERLNAPTIAAGAIAMAGAVILALARAQETGAAAGGPLGWLGDTLAFSGAIFYAGYLMILRKLGRTVNVGAVMFWATLGAAFVAAAASISFGEVMLPHTWLGWAMLVALGLIVHVGGQGLIAYGVGRLPLAASAVLLWMQPLVGAALSWIMFGETLGVWAFVGAALILAGIYAVQRARS